MIEEAFSRIFPASQFQFSATISYSGKFKPYNATVRRAGSRLHFSLSKSWQGVSEEITIGLLQHLLLKILARDRNYPQAAAALRKGGMNMQLYDEFIKAVSENTVPTESDAKLEASFARVNGKYFQGMVDKPGLKWGQGSFRKLASYDYHTNTITVSSLFREAPDRMVDYLMHHEMLHKKLKFISTNGKARHHNAEFKRQEARFEGAREMESAVGSYLRSARGKRSGWKRLLLIG